MSPARTAIVDASSAIILCRSGLHDFLAATYDVLLSESVYREITVKSSAGSLEYRQMADRGEIRVEKDPPGMERPETAGLGSGERAAILLFHAGLGDFIITDDGRAARSCRKAAIPFINALLFPVVLQYAGRQDDYFRRAAMNRIMKAGRYSDRIIGLAMECRREDIAFALP